MEEELILVLDDEEELLLTLDEDEELLLTLEDYASSYPIYDGDYVVTPRLNEEQVLETANKVMADNVTVNPVPVTITVNPYNGKTVVIG